MKKEISNSATEIANNSTKFPFKSCAKNSKSELPQEAEKIVHCNNMLDSEEDKGKINLSQVFEGRNFQLWYLRLVAIQSCTYLLEYVKKSDLQYEYWSKSFDGRNDEKYKDFCRNYEKAKSYIKAHSTEFGIWNYVTSL